MAQVGSLMIPVRKVFGDTNGDYLTDSILLTYFDIAQNIFCQDVWPIWRYKGLSVAANQESFALPSENIIVEIVINRQTLTRKLKYVSPRDYFTQQMAIPNATGTPVIYTHFEGNVHVFPRYSTASKTVAMASGLQASDASIKLASTDNLRTYGKVLFTGGSTSEEAEYTTKGSNYISSLTRGDGGTTAGSAASNATITQLDLEILYRRTATALSASTSTFDVPATYQNTLQNYVLYLAYMGEGQETKANFFLNLYHAETKQAAALAKRKTLELKAIKSVNSQVISGLYGGI